MAHPKKLVVLGGGTSSLTALFVLTSQPDWQKHFDITVYQQGWRLGGKGASGRNAAISQRIEEHGLHIWSGFYVNALRMMRSCYDELDRPPGHPLRRWDDAFRPHSNVSWAEEFQGQFSHWTELFESVHGLPQDAAHIPTPLEFLLRLLPLTIEFLKDHPQLPQENASTAPSFFEEVTHFLAHGVEVTGLELLKAALRLCQDLTPDAHQPDLEAHDSIRALLNAFLRWLKHHLQDTIDHSEQARHLFVLADLAVTLVSGMIGDGLLENGFDGIDSEDFRAWLKRHGASDLTLDCGLVRGTYCYIFAFEKGDTQRPNLAAGVALRMTLRLLLDYRGAIFWRMAAGMGDTVFTPIYQVLQKRGVQFRFFHQVQSISLGTPGAISKVTLLRQATVRSGEYQPLVDVRGVESWPSSPLYDQLLEGAELQSQGINLESAWSPWPGVEAIELNAGVDFDLVLSGISLAALPHLAPELLSPTQGSPAVAACLNHVQTVQTIGVQLWLKPDLEALGWKEGSTITTAYAEPLDTWADMTHLLPREEWPNDTCACILYFCGVLQDADTIPPFSDTQFPATEAQRAYTIALDWLKTHTECMWPRAVIPGTSGLEWDLLVDLQNGRGLERLQSQYWRANINPTDRYVISLSGTTQYRFKAEDCGISNLVFTGDWLRTGLNYGCVEASVMAGMQAARAILGTPVAIYGETDFPPASHS
jgi:uncharacterized protein with NAD-binding domain and iron-sulfur cluster